MVLALIGIIYGALVAMVQPNMKKLIAYSSVSHLGFVVLGIFSFTQAGLERRHVCDACSRNLHRRIVHAGGDSA
jgi:NADH:ubiquinone oxidoreductase subunit 4 (subunit M)